MAEIQLTVRCFTKIMMHALKYPHATVNGILIGEKKKRTAPSSPSKSENQDSSPARQASSYTLIVDCVPLFHSGHGLTPMMEAALIQVANYAKSIGGVIAGFYQANDYYYETNPDSFASRIAEKIWEQNSDSVLLMLNHFELSATLRGENQENFESVLTVYTYTPNDGKWRTKSSSSSSSSSASYVALSIDQPEKASAAFKELLEIKQYHLQLSDFDDHLNDISNDWTNGSMNKLVDEWLEASA